MQPARFQSVPPKRKYTVFQPAESTLYPSKDTSKKSLQVMSRQTQDSVEKLRQAQQQLITARQNTSTKLPNKYM